MSDFNDVGDFHRKMGLRTSSVSRVAMLPDLDDADVDDMLQFRVDFMDEELTEFKDGWAEQDHAKMADALIDLVYVAMGTAHLLNYPWAALWNEVQYANMQKERADGAEDARSTRKHMLDVVKPEGWQPPDVEGVLKYHRKIDDDSYAH
jgi:predicted HAD superfamily Cof-like phosphohydrolase